jgi:hypothetical protein
MERKYITYEKGIKVDVVEAKSDSLHDIQMSVLGEKAFTRKRFDKYRDPELEAQGFKILCLGNGSLFFNEGTQTYANGIEKAYGVVHENDDANWDGVGGFYIKDGVPYIYKQGHIKSVINDPTIRGAITGAFMLLNNGVTDISGARIGEPSRGIYLQKSGRTIIGKKADNTLVMAVFDGISGSTGLTGLETVTLARRLGLRHAVCMDGGASTYLKYKDTILNNSSREGANAVAIYYKDKIEKSASTLKSIEEVAKEVLDGKWGNGEDRKKALISSGYNPVEVQKMVNQLLSAPVSPPSIKPGDKVNIIGTFTVGNITPTSAFINELGIMIALSQLKKV